MKKVIVVILLCSMMLYGFTEKNEVATIESAMDLAGAKQIEYVILANGRIKDTSVFENYSMSYVGENKCEIIINGNIAIIEIINYDNDFWAKLTIESIIDVNETYKQTKKLFDNLLESRVFLNAKGRTYKGVDQKSLHKNLGSRVINEVETNIISVCGEIYGSNFIQLKDGTNFQTATNNNNQIVIGIPGIEILF